MINELLIYVLLLCVSISLCFFEFRNSSSKIFFSLTFLSYSALIFIVRNSGFDNDIEVYSESMAYDYISFYYLREPVVWFLQRFIFNIINDPICVFYISDMLLFLMLFSAYRRIGVPRYAYFSIILFVPFFLGFQNVYRQFAAMIFLVYAVSFIGKSNLIRMILFSLSFLSHNSGAIFFQLMFIKVRNVYFLLLSFVGYLIIPLILYFGADYKSKSSTGLSLEIIYILSLFLLLLIYLIFYDFKIKINDFYFPILINCLYICVLSVFFLSSASSERISMFALFIMYPYICILIENIKPLKLYFRVMFVILSSIPIFVFSSSNQFIGMSGGL